MSTKKWLSGLCLLAACGGGGMEGDHGTGPDGVYPWGSQNQNSAESKVQASIVASAQGDGSTLLFVELYDKDTQKPVALEDTDELVVRSDSGEVALQLEDELLPTRILYNGQLPGDEPGSKFEFTLHSEKWGDATAEVTLPDALTMTAPSADDDAPDLSEPFEVSWKDGASSDSARAGYILTCGNQFAQGWTSSAEGKRQRELDAKLDAIDAPCELSVIVQRHEFGSMEGAWGGSAVGMQVDSADWHIE